MILWLRISLKFLYLYKQGLTHFDEILQEADGIILSRGTLGIDLPPEKVIPQFRLAVHVIITQSYAFIS